MNYGRVWQNAGVPGALLGAAAQGQIYAAQRHGGAHHIAHARAGHADLQRSPGSPPTPLPDARCGTQDVHFPSFSLVFSLGTEPARTHLRVQCLCLKEVARHVCRHLDCCLALSKWGFSQEISVGVATSSPPGLIWVVWQGLAGQEAWLNPAIDHTGKRELGLTPSMQTLATCLSRAQG